MRVKKYTNEDIFAAIFVSVVLTGIMFNLGVFKTNGAYLCPAQLKEYQENPCMVQLNFNSSTMQFKNLNYSGHCGIIYTNPPNILVPGYLGDGLYNASGAKYRIGG